MITGLAISFDKPESVTDAYEKADVRSPTHVFRVAHDFLPGSPGVTLQNNVLIFNFEEMLRHTTLSPSDFIEKFGIWFETMLTNSEIAGENE